MNDVMIKHVLPKKAFVSVSRIGVCCFMLLVFGTRHTSAEFAAPWNVEHGVSSRGVPNACSAVFCNMTNPVQHHITTIFGHVFFSMREFAMDKPFGD